MRVLAIDHGTKRMGLALSDEMGMLALPLETFPAEPLAAFIDRLRVIVHERQVGELLVGMPRNMDGSYGPAAAKVQEFVTLLQKSFTVPVRTWDERLTSAQANRALIQADVRRADRRGKVDKMAAAILLQSYLDRQSAV